MSREDKTQNGKRMTETKLTGKKARKLSKKRAKIKKLQKVSKGNFAEGKITRIEPRRYMRTVTSGTSPWRNNIAVGPIYPLEFHPKWT
jgi:hypothetical protein